MIKKVFLVGLALYLLFYFSFGTVFGRDDLGDKRYHLMKAQNPLDCCKGEYYAPLLHFLALFLSLGFLDMNLVFSVLVPILLFLLLPMAFMAMCNVFWGEDVEDAVFYYLFGCWATVFFMLSCTWTQALNLFFVMVALALMFWRLRSGRGSMFNIVVVVLLGFFSHTEGGLWLLLIFLMFLCLLRQFKLILLLSVLCTLVFLCFPVLLWRPVSLLNGFWSNIGWNPLFFVEVLVLWTMPIAVYLLYRSEDLDGINSQSKHLLAFSVSIAFLLAVLDSNYRPILSAMVLLGIYGAYTLRKYPKLKPIMFWWTILWFLLLLGGLLLS